MTDYIADIARAADSTRAPSPVQLREAQAAMWARHRYEAWRTSPVASLSAGMVQPGKARRVERAL